jgi:hypothetical protein
MPGGGVVIALTLTGSGAYSLDTTLSLGVLWTPALKAGVLAAGPDGWIGQSAHSPSGEPARSRPKASVRINPAHRGWALPGHSCIAGFASTDSTRLEHREVRELRLETRNIVR